MVQSDERTPLLQSTATGKPAPSTPLPSTSSSTSSAASTAHDRENGSYVRLLATALLLSTSFTLTATTMMVEIQKIMCRLYYEDEGHVPSGHWVDRCSDPTVQARSAQAIALLATVTTFSGVINLVTTGVITRKLGVRAAMVSQTAWPVARILAQLWAIVHNGRGSVAVLTWTQLLTMGGGGAGYSLTANTYANELVTAEERTQAFGVLSGIMMLGNSAGLFFGGILGAKVHPAAPFLAATVLLSVSTILSGCFLPYIPPAPVDAKKGGLFAPIRPFAPRGGWWGLPLLASGTFLAAFATSFLPLLLQLHGTQSYHFEADTNGYLMTLTALSRAFFLTLLFPRIISSGRSWYSTSPSSSAATSSSSSAANAPVNAKSSSASSAQTEDAAATAPPLPTSFAEMEDAGAAGIEHAGEPALATPEPTTEAKGRGFDLVFLRGSIFVDACLTALLPFAFEGWHLFVAGGLLPLASGTAPAAKGVVLEMVPKEEESDALQGIALLECLAMMTTISLSGFVFSFLTSKGTPGYTFFVNAAMALLAFFILLCVRFRPTRSTSAA